MVVKRKYQNFKVNDKQPLHFRDFNKGKNFRDFLFA